MSSKNLKQKIEERLVTKMLENFFANDKNKNLLAKKFLNNYIYNKQTAAAYILQYKQNIYNSNFTVINELFTSGVLDDTDIEILKLRYSKKYTFTYIAVKTEMSLNVIYRRHGRILDLLYFLMTGEISFKSIYMLSPKLLLIAENRLSNEYNYALLGKDLVVQNKILLNLDVKYLDILECKQKNINFLRWLIERYLENLKNKGSLTEYNILNDTLNNIHVKSKDLGDKYFVSDSRVIQIWSAFKKEIKTSYCSD